MNIIKFKASRIGAYRSRDQLDLSTLRRTILTTRMRTTSPSPKKFTIKMHMSDHPGRCLSNIPRCVDPSLSFEVWVCFDVSTHTPFSSTSSQNLPSPLLLPKIGHVIRWEVYVLVKGRVEMSRCPGHFCLERRGIDGHARIWQCQFAEGMGRGRTTKTKRKQ